MNKVYIVYHQDIDYYCVYRVGSVPNVIQAVQCFIHEDTARKWCCEHGFEIVYSC